MDKKALVGNTLIFLISALAVLISIRYLGSNNLMVGITALFLLIAILNKDFSRTPFRAIFKISFLTVFIGIVPYLVNLNIYTGLIINFLAVFIMLYLVVYTLNKTIYFPFLFGYTLLLETNVVGHNLTLRLVGLFVVGVIAVLFQIVFIKLTSKRELKKDRLIDIIDALVVISKNSIKGEKNQEHIEKFKSLSTYWSRDILERRNNSFYLNEKEDAEINLIASMERMETIVTQVAGDIKVGHKQYEELLINTNLLLDTLKRFLAKEIDKKILDREIDRLIKLYYAGNNTEVVIYQIIEILKVIDTLADNIYKFENKKRTSPNIINYLKPKSIKAEIIGVAKILSADFNRNSVRFIFAFRTAVLISVAYFIVQYFDLALGKWMIFTITSVSQPYNNTVRNRAKGRIIGTLIGAAIYLPLSYIFVAVDARIIIISIAVYFMISFKKYAYITAMLTVLFLGVVTIDVSNVLLYAWDRVFYVALGIIAVLIGNKLIFPYSIEKETKILIKKYHEICNEIMEMSMKVYTVGNRAEIRNLIISAKGMENKILINNTILDSQTLREFRNEERILLSNIQNILNRIKYTDTTLKENTEQRVKRLGQMKEEIEKSLFMGSKNCRYILGYYCVGIEKLNEKLIYVEFYEMIVAHYRSVKLERKLTY